MKQIQECMIYSLPLHLSFPNCSVVLKLLPMCSYSQIHAILKRVIRPTPPNNVRPFTRLQNQQFKPEDEV